MLHPRQATPSKRWFLAFLYSLPFLVPAGPGRADDWPQWMGPQRDGVWREDGILDKFPAGGPKVLWKEPCGVGYAGPSVAGGKLYLPDFVPQDKLPEGGFAKGRFSGQERLVCRDATTGKELWATGY